MKSDRLGYVLKGLMAAVLLALAAPSYAAPPTGTVRRITADQYRNIIRDVFGPSVKLGGYFEPGIRINGLLVVGTSTVAVTSAGMEQYDAIARIIAGQVTDEKHRAQMIPCAPKNAATADDACARVFFLQSGRLLFRRPLKQIEIDAHVGAARLAAKASKDFYTGLNLSLAAMLSSPQFLFREASTLADSTGAYHLDGFSKASQLSFFLWNSSPDLLLLAAAEKGDLDTPQGLARQVDRMMASPRLEAGIRAFFIDNLGFDKVEALTKDAALFPKFSASVAEEAQEQTLKTLVDLLLKQRGDYRDIFTTKKTFLTPELATIYRVPMVNDVPNGAPDSWQPYEFPASDPRGGILTQVAFTALHSPPGRSSPTLRGKALREILLCQKVPPPPGDVQFNLINDTSNPQYRTARKRLIAHSTSPVCAGCHKIMDPMGLALETFDGAGAYRTTENGDPIDTSGALSGVAFADAAGLGTALHDSPAATSCLVNRLTFYGLGRVSNAEDKAWLDTLGKTFADNGYRIPDLMRMIATSPEFYTVSTSPKTETEGTHAANPSSFKEASR